MDLWRKNAIMEHSNKQRSNFVHTDQMGGSFIPFTFCDLKFAFIVLFNGYVASTAVLSVEISWLRLTSK